MSKLVPIIRGTQAKIEEYIKGGKIKYPALTYISDLMTLGFVDKDNVLVPVSADSSQKYTIPISEINNKIANLQDNIQSVQNEVNSLESFPALTYSVVTALPTEDISVQTLYLLKNKNGKYDQYLYIEDKWSNLGELDVNLSSFYTKEETDKAINSLSDKTDTTVSAVKEVADANTKSINTLTSKVQAVLSTDESGNPQLDTKMDKIDPTGVGSFSLNGTATGENAVATGTNTTASGKNSHAEGNTTNAVGENSHAEGKGVSLDSFLRKSKRIYFKDITTADGTRAIDYTTAYEDSACTVPLNTSNNTVRAFYTYTGGSVYFYRYDSDEKKYKADYEAFRSSVLRDARGTAFGDNSHAESGGTAYGDSSHADSKGIAVGCDSHASAFGTAFQRQSFATVGGTTTAPNSFAAINAQANGMNSFAVGRRAEANGFNSIAIGNGAVATQRGQVATGKFNIGKEDTVFEVGNGNGSERANGFEVTEDGYIRLHNSDTKMYISVEDGKPQLHYQKPADENETVVPLNSGGNETEFATDEQIKSIFETK